MQSWDTAFVEVKHWFLWLECQGSVVCIMVMGWQPRNFGLIPSKLRFFVLQSILIGSESHLASHSMSTGESFHADKVKPFTFMWPCIVTNFVLNNQLDTLIIQIYSVIKLCMFRASSLPIIRSYLLYIQHWYASCMKRTSAECTVDNSW